MPGPDARQLTREHRARLSAIADDVTRRVRQLAARADTADIDGWFARIVKGLVALLAAAWRTILELTEIYIEDHAAAEGRTVEPQLAEWNTEQVMTSLRVTGPVAFKTAIGDGQTEPEALGSMASQMAGSATKIVLRAERDTVMATVEASEQIVGWRRVPDDDPCAWCAMLVSRGATYSSRSSATRVVGRRGAARGNQPLGASYHDHCQCTAEPLYEHEQEPPEVEELFDEWERVTAPYSGAEKLRKWREYWDNRPSRPTRAEPEPELAPEPEPEPVVDERERLSWLDDDDEDWGAIVDAAEKGKPDDVRDLLIRKDEREARPTVDIGRLATDPLKPLTKKRRAEVDQAARELFDGVYAGIEAKVTSVEVGTFNRMTVVQGDLLDASGRKIGYFVRGYRYVDRFPGPGQDLVARHETLEITDRELRGQGFASAFNGHLEASYRASGVARITLTASLDNGGYAWARAGYDWATEWTAANIATSLERMIFFVEADPENYKGRNVTEALAEAKALLGRMNSEPFGSANFPTPYEISQLGRWDGAGRDDLWLGKQALLGRTWEGVKPL